MMQQQKDLSGSELSELDKSEKGSVKSAGNDESLRRKSVKSLDSIKEPIDETTR